jgi:PIN domain nuclease of toxin-antitoxin system
VIILDTHAWLWWQSTDDKLSHRAHAEVERADRIGICTASCYELARAAARGRIRLDRDVRIWVSQALEVDRVEPLTLTSRIAASAGALAEKFPGDLVDRIIYATAQEHGARLVTRDGALRRAAPDLTIW